MLSMGIFFLLPYFVGIGRQGIVAMIKLLVVAIEWIICVGEHLFVSGETVIYELCKRSKESRYKKDENRRREIRVRGPARRSGENEENAAE